MKFFYALGLVASSYMVYKMKTRERENNLLLVHSNSKLAKFFKFITDHFLENYADGLLYPGHLQTFLLELIGLIYRIFKKYLKYFRFKYYYKETFNLKDGGTIVIDHAKCKDKRLAKEKNRILIVIPGFTSESDEYYIKNFLNDFVEEFDCRVMNVRGFGTKLTSPHMISTYCFNEVKEYLEYTCLKNLDKKIFAVGFSYGGMLLTRCLGSWSQNIPSNLIGGCGICYPMCLKSTKNHVEPQLGGFYSKYGSRSLKKCFLDNLDTIFSKEHLNSEHILLKEKETIIEKITNLQHVAEFDEIYTYKILNFNSCEDYYNDSKLGPYLEKIKIPFLSIFTKDDPIIPYEAIPLKLFQQNSNLITIISKKGGHMGFFKGLLPHRWIDTPIKTFIKTVEIIQNAEDISLCSSKFSSNSMLVNLDFYSGDK